MLIMIKIVITRIGMKIIVGMIDQNLNFIRLRGKVKAMSFHRDSAKSRNITAFIILAMATCNYIGYAVRVGQYSKHQ